MSDKQNDVEINISPESLVSEVIQQIVVALSNINVDATITEQEDNTIVILANNRM